MTVEQTMASISAAAAAISTCLAVWSTYIANKALRMSKKEFESKDAILSLYLMDGFRFKNNLDGQLTSILSFSISITNKATAANCIMRIELHVDGMGKSGKSTKYIIGHDPSLNEYIRGRDITTLEYPKSLGPKESVAGWVLFAEYPIIPKNFRRDSYSIVITDANGSVVQVDAVIVRDLENV